MIIVRYCMTAFALLLAQTALGADEAIPPPDLGYEITAAATMAEKPALRLTMGPLVVTLEQTTLDEIVAEAGAGRISEKGDTGEHIFWLCYTISAKSGWQRLWLESGAELGRVHVTGVAATLLPPQSRVPLSCPLLPQRLQVLSLDHGIWLGSTETDVQRSLGKPSGSKNGLSNYYYSKPVDRSDPVIPFVPDLVEQGFTISNALTVEYRNGRIDRLFVSRITTN